MLETSATKRTENGQKDEYGQKSFANVQEPKQQQQQYSHARQPSTQTLFWLQKATTKIPKKKNMRKRKSQRGNTLTTSIHTTANKHTSIHTHPSSHTHTL